MNVFKEELALSTHVYIFPIRLRYTEETNKTFTDHFWVPVNNLMNNIDEQSIFISQSKYKFHSTYEHKIYYLFINYTATIY
jgi:hypothetical protein